MIFRYTRKLLQPSLIWFLVIWLPVAIQGATDDSVTEQRIGVALRMIGHEVLQCLGDTHSRVLPVEKVTDEENFKTYHIPFDFQFEFDPADIIQIIDHVMARANLSSDYLVQVEQCETKAIVHSFEVRNAYPDLIPCSGRILPKDCYNLLITLFDSYHPQIDISSTSALSTDESHKSMPLGKSTLLQYSLFLVPILLILGFTGYLMSKRTPSDLENPNLVSLGAYQWDKKHMILSLQDQSIPLSHKEAALLTVLHSNANQPMEREVLLQEVWGDEGDYIGRTLDVFVSKLRKKLEADATIKIVNIRGIGYKLVVG